MPLILCLPDRIQYQGKEAYVVSETPEQGKFLFPVVGAHKNPPRAEALQLSGDQARERAGDVIEPRSRQAFMQLLKSNTGRLVVVCVSADWCPPSKRFKPTWKVRPATRASDCTAGRRFSVCLYQIRTQASKTLQIMMCLQYNVGISEKVHRCRLCYFGLRAPSAAGMMLL